MSSPQHDSSSTYKLTMAPGGAGGDDSRRPPGAVLLPDSPQMGVLQAGWLEMLRPELWHLFCTLTFRHRDVSLDAIVKKYLGLIRRLARESLNSHADVDRIPFFFAVEELRVNPHIHTVIAAPKGGRPVELASVHDYWVRNSGFPRIGKAKIEPFDPDRAEGGLIYITKTADYAEHFGVNLLGRGITLPTGLSR